MVLSNHGKKDAGNRGTPPMVWRVGLQQEIIRIQDLPTVRNKNNWVLGLKTLIVTASGWTDDRQVSKWIDEAIDTRRSWDDLIDSGHKDLVRLDVKLADALQQFFKSDNTKDNAQRLYMKRIA